jgi:hypothetical protein
MHSGTSKLLSEDELCAYEDRIADLIGAVGIDERCACGKQQRLFGVSFMHLICKPDEFNLPNQARDKHRKR